jgi:N-acetylglutamate synthase-like GNAT family acetyltransferase
VPEIRIRPYHADDRDACARLWAQLVEHHRGLYDDESLGAGDPAAALDDYLRTARAWVAEQGGRVVGLAGTIATDPKAELEPVVVDRNVRGRGVGRLLVEAAVADALVHGAQQVFVRPVARNAEAIRFFHACGLDVLTRVELATGLRAGEAQPSDQQVAQRRFRT